MTPIERPTLPTQTTGLIDGEPIESIGAHRLAIIDPDTGEKASELIETGAEDVGLAVQSAQRAFETGEWSRATIPARHEVLIRAATLIRERASELAAADAATTGLPYHSAAYPHVMGGAGWFDYFASAIRVQDEKLFRQLPGALTTVTREPVGVVGLFTPWNIPLVCACLKLSAALAAGNSCVLKPSEQSPFGVHQLIGILHEAGLPRGVVQLVNGRGAVTGAALASHPLVRALSFTGGETAGRLIAAEAAKRFAKITMELGGKSANIVFADADYERALDGSLAAIYANNGEACLSGSRILVQKPIADRFIADFAARVRKIRIGRPFEDTVEIGPQSSGAHMSRVLSYIDIAREEGAEIVEAGGRVHEMGEGYYIRPSVVRARDSKARVCQEEIFGPFATFLVFEDEAEAVSLANDTRFGLAGYVWTENLGRAHRVASALRSGYVLINTSMLRETNAPFGGMRQSGIDREGGRWSLDFYSEAKTTVTSLGTNPLPLYGKH